MSTTHTPGPWYIHGDSKEIHPNGDEDGLIILAEIDPEGILPMAENRPNARLIAAAPELLGALELIAKRSRTLLHRDAQGEIEDFETEVKNLLGAIIETAEANAGKAHG